MVYSAMKLLVHTCCADCLLKMVDSLKNEFSEEVEITAYFYNPNIHPRAEYLTRLKAAQQISEENKIELIVPDWSPREWFKIQNPSVLRTAPLDPPSQNATDGQSKGEQFKNKTRCKNCWSLRLKKTFEYAHKKGFEMVSSTLVTSHYQNKEQIEEIGKKLEKEFEIEFLVPKVISKELKTSGFYKQNYCGCGYSLVEAWREKFK